jgi:hypothetical protein
VSFLPVLLGQILLAAFAIWRLSVAWRAADRAYAEGWRDGYDLGHVHGASGAPAQRERSVPKSSS